MEDWDNPAYPFTVFELAGGIRVCRIRVENGELVTFVAGGREVSCPMRPDDCGLPDGALLSYPGTWFWRIDCEFTPLPYGPFKWRFEAEDAARRMVVELMTSDREMLARMLATRH
jgi:hypothetical protein